MLSRDKAALRVLIRGCQRCVGVEEEGGNGGVEELQVGVSIQEK